MGKRFAYANLGVLCISAAMLMAGCATIATFLREPEIGGDPERTGLMIVDCRIITNFSDRGLLETLFESNDEADVVGGTISGSGGVEFEGTVQGGLLLFESLPPDTYVVRLIRGERKLSQDSSRQLYDCPGTWWKSCPELIKLEYLIHTDDHRRLTFEVDAGEFAYVGRLAFDESHEPPFSSGGTVFDEHRHHNPREVLSIDEASKYEMESLEKLVSNRSPNIWTERIQARLVELGGARGESREEAISTAR